MVTGVVRIDATLELYQVCTVNQKPGYLHKAASCHATRRKQEGWDITRLPKPRQGKSRGKGRVRNTDLPLVNVEFTVLSLDRIDYPYVQCTILHSNREQSIPTSSDDLIFEVKGERAFVCESSSNTTDLNPPPNISLPRPTGLWVSGKRIISPKCEHVQLFRHDNSARFTDPSDSGHATLRALSNRFSVHSTQTVSTFIFFRFDRTDVSRCVK
ncbi:hypothetical protein CLF_100720 [Clonorchis sinensis]|uniref:Uncharacterized protein n=1 Tax=Clonorchis sinensis TaxID=79923 RepID=G7Y434_CLOSI|nr:hypothetical protein CLF_100720 [Clonorchis sinensis]